MLLNRGTLAVTQPAFWIETLNIAGETLTGPSEIQADVSAGGLLSALSGGDFLVVSAKATATPIELTFPNAANDYFVNSVIGAITGAGAGLFSGEVPAVLGTSLDVTYGTGGWSTGVSDPLIVAATNEVIQAITRIMDPVELLGQNGGGLSSSCKKNRLARRLSILPIRCARASGARRSAGNVQGGVKDRELGLRRTANATTSCNLV